MQERRARNGSTYYLGTLEELVAMSTLRPVASGDHLRLGCPFHGSDTQRSLRVVLSDKKFNCFCCGARGFITGPASRGCASSPPPRPERARREPQDLRCLLEGFQRRFRGSRTHRYLTSRHIAVDTASAYGAGYCPAGGWPGRSGARQWPRVVFPLETPGGELIGLYSRAVDKDYPTTKAPKEVRHDIAGRRGLFNAAWGLREACSSGALHLTEGVFDCLAMIQTGYPGTVALIGTDGFLWESLQGIRELYLCLDRDQSGLAKARGLARQAALRGITAYVPGDDEYGGFSEPSEQYEATGKVTLAEEDDGQPL